MGWGGGGRGSSSDDWGGPGKYVHSPSVLTLSTFSKQIPCLLGYYILNKVPVDEITEDYRRLNHVKVNYC